MSGSRGPRGTERTPGAAGRQQALTNLEACLAALGLSSDVLDGDPFAPVDQLGSEGQSNEATRRRTALRVFLLSYRHRNPAVLSALFTLRSPCLREDGRCAYTSWLEEFGLPDTRDMGAEVIHVKLRSFTEQKTSREDLIWGFEPRDGRLPGVLGQCDFPFQLELRGWMPSAETIEGAEKRILSEFSAQLRLAVSGWKARQEHLDSERHFRERERSAVRNLEWLAWKQANRWATVRAISEDSRWSEDTVSRGLRKAADLIGLPHIRIRQAPKGRRTQS